MFRFWRSGYERSWELERTSIRSKKRNQKYSQKWYSWALSRNQKYRFQFDKKSLKTGGYTWQCFTLKKSTWVIKIYPLEADRLFEQLNDPKLQQILGMYIAALKNKSNNSYSSVLKKLKNSLSVLTSTNSISGELWFIFPGNMTLGYLSFYRKFPGTIFRHIHLLNIQIMRIEMFECSIHGKRWFQDVCSALEWCVGFFIWIDLGACSESDSLPYSSLAESDLIDWEPKNSKNHNN